ncbi:MAG: hypothetical protein ACYSSO_07375 [Planctomycetota bacterium]|jgi:hypothetical protein
MDQLDAKFWIYHEENPHVFELFTKFAVMAKSAGYQYYSAKAIFERVRWQINIETKDPEGFKLNNNYTSRYARLLVDRRPAFNGFFRNRVLKTRSLL